MLRALLVDDEPFILKGLCAMLDWEAQGFCVAGTAENGRQALAFLREKPVDLIIADIRMPEMDGLELLKTIREHHISDARFVFLSGIGDFSFAQEAIRLRCTEYILKPVQKSDLLRLLADTASSVKKEERRKLQSTRMEEAFYARSMVALLMGKYDDADLKNVRARLGETQDCQYVGMEAADSENERTTEDDKRAFQRKLYRACLEFIGDEGSRYCIFSVTQRKGCYDVGILYCGALRGLRGMDGHDFFERLRAFASHAVHSPVMYYAGCRVHELTQLSESYRTAFVARTCRSFKPGKATVWFENKMKGRPPATLDKSVLDALIGAVAANDRPGIASHVAELYTQIRHTDLDEDLIHLDIDYFLFHLVHLAARQDANIDQEDILRYISENAFDRDVTHGSEQHFLRFATEYAAYLASLRNKCARGVLAKIEREIETHYAEDLSLKTLGEKYYLNSAYLGQLFKKQFGVSFKSYLTNLRVEKAAGILLQTDEKVYKVAEKVGYRDIDYFIDRFVEIKGCTPTKFRRQAYGGEKKEAVN